MKAPFGDQVIYQNIVLVNNLSSVNLNSDSWAISESYFTNEKIVKDY